MTINATLVTEPLWRKIKEKDMEMIVNCNGRMMFPRLHYTFSGLSKVDKYILRVEIHRVDEYKYAYVKNGWCRKDLCVEDVFELQSIYTSIRNGDELMNNIICIDNFRLTNSKQRKKDSHIYLPTMYKYIPILSIFKVSDNWKKCDYENINPIAQFKYSFTQFFAVTSYKNKEIIMMKKKYNPYAFGPRSHRSNDSFISNFEEKECAANTQISDSFSSLPSPSSSSSSSQSSVVISEEEEEIIIKDISINESINKKDSTPSNMISDCIYQYHSDQYFTQMEQFNHHISSQTHVNMNSFNNCNNMSNSLCLYHPYVPIDDNFYSSHPYSCIASSSSMLYPYCFNNCPYCSFYHY